MIRLSLQILAVMFAAAAHSAPPFPISRESIDASKPPRVVVTSITATAQGAQIVAFAFSPAGISNFLSQLERAGATNVQLSDIKPVSVCERRLIRAEFRIDGDASYLAELESSTEQLTLLLNEGKRDTSCIPHLPP